ncbi:thioesterase II family protein [Streptantibioticus cattleyicolor]|uniref:Oleoyl-(Acyl-carrier-protein) hydrolase n=1 Tax=Streptantibioticus cattleyicolor (strain ATCC 35852 / DSM 46488 / JCM 4925 / NBRC 14057 / NRRL 8057) TaxID=1003195 RepID=F8JKH3_STREN|nr:alpha/beta fold hydrolase [Streptantibioticus cattleyicolor]AEW99760.1 Oleoyl-(acyl-carrier-protein) hydrolase [Streptantibioticus cattleyicolor NRRL 8057 = DSM 46488]CCB71202.1 putative Predicted thioesterase involved in non-ribosomal peptide biosynthesis [Streptantibioticus cattleyicolor NRRL 8057 = DSM 46488]
MHTSRTIPRTEGDWFWLPDHRPHAAVRLLCFPHAGGDATAFTTLGRLLPEEIEVWGVRMPGRGGRARDPYPESFEDLVQAVADAALPHLDRPYAVLGQSVGALVGYEAARKLSAQLNPTACFVIGFAPPHTWREPPGSGGEDDARELADFMLRNDERAGAVVTHPALGEMAQRALLADMGLARTYRDAGTGPLDCPVQPVLGADDEAVTAGEMAEWKRCFTGSRPLEVVEAGHLVLQSGEAAVRQVGAVVQDVLLPSLYQ